MAVAVNGFDTHLFVPNLCQLILPSLAPFMNHAPCARWSRLAAVVKANECAHRCTGSDGQCYQQKI